MDIKQSVAKAEIQAMSTIIALFAINLSKVALIIYQWTFLIAKRNIPLLSKKSLTKDIK
jgi:hypothetical protein